MFQAFKSWLVTSTYVGSRSKLGKLLNNWWQGFEFAIRKRSNKSIQIENAFYCVVGPNTLLYSTYIWIQNFTPLWTQILEICTPGSKQNL